MNDSFVFFRSYFEAISTIKTKKNQLLLFQTICDYALNGKEPETLPGEVKGLFISQKPNIDATLRRRKANTENGQKGGAPKGNQNARKQPKNNPTEQPKNNLNANANVNVNANVNANVNGDEEEQNNPAPAYGRFHNVYLSDSELDQLKNDFFDWEDKIEKLSEHIASKGAQYVNHYATICKWARQDEEKRTKVSNNQQGKTTKADELYSFYRMTADWANEDN